MDIVVDLCIEYVESMQKKVYMKIDEHFTKEIFDKAVMY